jgi:hypothetical protein
MYSAHEPQLNVVPKFQNVTIFQENVFRTKLSAVLLSLIRCVLLQNVLSALCDCPLLFEGEFF